MTLNIKLLQKFLTLIEIAVNNPNNYLFLRNARNRNKFP